MFNILSTFWYSLPKPGSSDSDVPLTYTLIVEVSTNELSIKNRWSSDPFTVNVFVKYVPWYTTILLNEPVLEIMLPFASDVWVVVVVIDSGIENT